MKAFINRSTVSGRVTVPASKSYTIRAIIVAALAKGTSKIINPLYADDTLAVIDVLNNLGVPVIKELDGITVHGGALKTIQADLNCRDSAATLRFMAATCAILPGTSNLVAGPSLAKRPIKPLLDILEEMGARTAFQEGRVTIKGGNLKGGVYEIKGDESSQFVSALLLISPLIGEDVIFQLTGPPRSLPYIKMTLGVMQQFGINIQASEGFTRFTITPQNYRPAQVCIEGDWSSASYLIALGALQGNISVEGLNLLSLQGDKAIVPLLEKMGAYISPGIDSINVKASTLHSLKADMSQCIDLLPTVSILAALASGKSQLKGIARARLKESNRVHAVKKGLKQLGIKVTENDDTIEIEGGKPRGAAIDSFNDHRIAMAFAVLGLKTGEVIIQNAECVSKTYPGFWKAMRQLGGNIRLENE